MGKLNDEPWKAVTRQMKQLWLKFQQANNAANKAQ